MTAEWSIIIPARNEEGHLPRCLDSLVNLSFEGSFEVIVVDNGSSDKTCFIARSYLSKLDIKVLSCPEANVGAVRNAGVQQAKGQLLAFVDADCAVVPSWLTEATVVLNEHRDAIVGAQYALPPDAGWPARVWTGFFHDQKQGDTSYVPGGNLLIDADLFRRIGGFDPALRSNEDSQFCCRARARGTRVLAFRQLAVIHFGAERDLPHFVRRQLWHGSNVLNASGLKGNIRAIALAMATLACLCTLLVSALLQQLPLFFGSALALGCIPLAIMALRKTVRRPGEDLSRLFVLLLMYALVRAIVFPLALFRAVSPARMS